MTEFHYVGEVNREDVLVAAHAALGALVLLAIACIVLLVTVVQSSHPELAPVLVSVPCMVSMRLNFAVVPAVRRLYEASGFDPVAELTAAMGRAKAWWRSHE